MNIIKKWYTYQKERFPVLVYGLYILAIVFAIFGFIESINVEESRNIKQYVDLFTGKNVYYTYTYKIQWLQLIPMFIVAFLQFFMVRIVDEFKDYDEDCLYRPYRPVPRGLITLRELRIVFLISFILQAILTIFYIKVPLFYKEDVGNLTVMPRTYLNFTYPLLLILLWGYFFLMSKNFFMKKFLSKHLLLEVFLDELLMPIMGLYLIGFLSEDVFNIPDIWKILLLTYIISWIVEIARKVRCKEDEEEGVKTYTAVLGIPKTILILFILELLLMFIQISILGDKYILFAILTFIIASIPNIIFDVKKNKKCAKLVEIFANAYIIIAYLSIGLKFVLENVI